MRDLNTYQRSYSALPFENQQLRFRKRKLLEILARYAPRSVLEIGCGLDPLFMHYSAFDALTIVEPGDVFYRNALDLAQDFPKVRVVAGTLETTVEQLSSQPYDFIVLSSLLHEVVDAAEILRATRCLCSETTVVHVNVPNAWSFHRVLALEMGLIETVYQKSGVQLQMQQSRTFDLDSLSRLATDCGFRSVEQGTFFVKPFTHAQMAALQNCGFLTEQMLEGLYRMSTRFPLHGSEIFINLKVDK